MYHCIYIYLYIYIYVCILDAHHTKSTTGRPSDHQPGLRPSFSITEHRLGLLAVLVQEIEHGRMMRNEVEPRAPDIHTIQSI